MVAPKKSTKISKTERPRTKLAQKSIPKSKSSKASSNKLKEANTGLKASKSKSASKAVVDSHHNKKAPSFSLPMTGEGSFNFKTYKGKWVVLYFYPKDMTPGCTIEGRDFSSLISEFKKENAVVLGISKDSLDRHKKFIEKESYQVQLVSDLEGEACRWFDVIKEKNMYGKKVMGIERSTFLVNPSGDIVKVWRKVKVEGHAQSVLDELKRMNQ